MLAAWKLPKHVMICGVKILIKQVKKSNGLYGHFDPATKAIYINLTLCDSEEEQRLTLFHEMCHAVLHLTGQSFTINNEDVEEGIVRALEHLLPAVDKHL